MSFQLTGDGATGLVLSDTHAQSVSLLSNEVKLGRNPSSVRPVALRLESFVDNLKLAVPAKIDWYTAAAVALARMYLNNKMGCCVISGKGHNLGIWSANDKDSANGEIIQATDQEILSQYQGVCGRGDNGCNIASVLNYMVQSGFIAGGKRYKLRGYCAFDWQSKELTQIAIALGGAITIGFNIPNSWMNSAVWDYGPTNFVGGHDVSPCGYGTPTVINTTKDGVVVSSWGRLYLITWQAWQSTRYLDEAYFMVPEFLWTGTDKQSPTPGVDLTALLAAMDLIKGGKVPPLPDPTPIPDPIPDPPPLSGINMPLPGGGTLQVDYATKVITHPSTWTAKNELNASSN